ncbi:DUF2550 domain-containing protein [Streptomyces sp. Je 1-4]|uniref:DUF2550 domain-containing protein n=1 Tax=Streptomyces lydicus TaxID=47763 RepID=A0A3S9YH62_9ACTN|nr:MULTISPECIES: DUF2550 domain-containing protein [Streptomyces]AZS74168.1 DUF2550 domain-containing protein [Streptomyces lydicus]QIK06556.1 DUF2550 domain-containing protein [Streptomyces sp. ID38640]UYB39917.1 DUF2550 domain-containing protein [Streptomyces sp. Je 1-4]UZQ35981.1 DUF2550 domain-containing protein [Streptomyces sp. Je 1-4] [Streptomyces sp. Je 1-4 4N24]UZQ43399.1 DUF2550 domain-containing protein [Streptomyces sp. Je 1-4] [Streptomyces sp. Je 1-4 4N24_ara]
MFLALLVSGIVVVLVLLGLFVFGLRRRLIQRSGGTFDCSLRWNVPENETGGKGWIYGVSRYNGDRIEWFRVFSYAPRPRHLLERSAIEVLERRTPQGEEELALLSDSLVLACRHRGTRLELAMSEDALTGFLAWLEAAPPGQRVNVA